MIPMLIQFQWSFWLSNCLIESILIFWLNGKKCIDSKWCSKMPSRLKSNRTFTLAAITVVLWLQSSLIYKMNNHDVLTVHRIRSWIPCQTAHTHTCSCFLFKGKITSHSKINRSLRLKNAIYILSRARVHTYNCHLLTNQYHTRKYRKWRRRKKWNKKK